MSLTEKIWGETAELRDEENTIMGWLDSPIICDYYTQPKITGDANTNWLIGTCKIMQIPSETKWLSLGCGGGGLEIFAAKNGLFREMEAFDISPQVIKVAKKNAAKERITNISFNIGDFNTMDFHPKEYDVVLMGMSLHHTYNLEQLFSRLKTGLKMDGLFILNEYVGPSQMQFTTKQLEIVNHLLNILPGKYRFDYVLKQIKDHYSPRSREEWVSIDPSEAIRSNEIVPLLNEYFTIIHKVEYGGTLLNPLTEHIIGNFKYDSEIDVAILRLLVFIEEILIAERILPSDFSVLVMRNNKNNWFQNLRLSLKARHKPMKKRSIQG